MNYQMPVLCDLGRAAVDDAAARFFDTVPLYECTLYVATYNRSVAHRIQAEVGCAVVIVPAIILKNKEVWGLAYHGDCVWSAGII